MTGMRCSNLEFGVEIIDRNQEGVCSGLADESHRIVSVPTLIEALGIDRDNPRVF
jgi:hypothetical protein